MPAEPLPPVSHRVGGRWLLSTPLILFICAGTAVSVFAGEPSASASGSGALRWFLVWAVTAVTYALTVLLLRRCFAERFRRGGHLPLWLVLAIVLGATVLIGLLFHLGAQLLGLPEQHSLLWGIVVDVPFGLWFGLGFVLLLDERDRAQQARRTLVERRVVVDFADLQQGLLTQSLREACWRDIEHRLSASRRSMLAQLAHIDDASVSPQIAAVAEELRALAEGSVRDVGAAMWARAEREFPRLRVRDVLLGIARSEPFHPWIMALIVLVVGVAGVAAATVSAAGIALVVAAATYMAVILLVANRVMSRSSGHRAPVCVAALVGSQMYLVPFAIVANGLVSDSISWPWVLVQGVAGMITIGVVSAVGSWVHGGRELRRAYMHELDETQLCLIARARAMTAVARDVSRELHGTLQTKLIAAAMASERAIASGDRDALQASFDEARRVLEAIGPDERPIGDVAEEVAQRVALWDGLCEIELVADGLAGASADAEAVGRVAEEGLANAVRHGGAARIAVTVRGLGDGAVEVVVEDDGTGLAGAAPGLGSAILDAATAGNWGREATSNGCRLVARVPAAASPAVASAAP